ncbi:hypothetical protein N356_gp008 [Cellulophaga phage phi14:2]|uniref:Uncharacterized protein n=1 Tax=Cellulophaga phage phi14:2 TaxID=1327990 RepID=S0A3T5_9CAUD|nr:hypothetical protein N356_gp008 [Cellulophaga phage phi14:2]AGO48898.1 hypothetical protein Phi14:2_gp020 [Cellulophaga phage phi14:2]
MKKYKLIQKYPGSPDLNTERNWTEGTWEDINDFSKDCFYNPQDYPKFWQEVIEKDYEVLSVINPLQNNCEILENLENGYSFEYKLNKFPHLQIKSVKRLSDGEVFTVGDRICFKYYNGNVSSILHKIEIKESEIVYTTDYGKRTQFLNVKHVEKPLFTTEDGIDIFEGDGYWYVQDGSEPTHHHYPNQAKYTKLKGADILKLSDKGVKRFSTKETAEEYILMNKPCLSINDVLSAPRYLGDWSKNLKELVKSKMK